MRRALTPADFPLVACDALVFARAPGTTPLFLCPDENAAHDLADLLNAGAAAAQAIRAQQELPPEPVQPSPEGWGLDRAANAI